jgi:hypothetical protein
MREFRSPSGRAGRPQLYCDSACRQRTLSAAGRLQIDIARLEAEIAAVDLTHRAQRAIPAELAQTRWLLSAYPESALRSGAGRGTGAEIRGIDP